jgi:hypothetical protein
MWSTMGRDQAGKTYKQNLPTTPSRGARALTLWRELSQKPLTTETSGLMSRDASPNTHQYTLWLATCGLCAAVALLLLTR